MRDAMVAALSLNIFQRHTDRVKMANIAQIANVLQSMVLTDTKGNGHMVLTPTYHVFRMYNGFQEATYLPTEVKSDYIPVEGGHMQNMVDGVIPAVSASAAKKQDGGYIISLVNPSLDKKQEVEIVLDGANIKSFEGEILTSKDIKTYNDFDNPNKVTPAAFKDAKVKKNKVSVKIPAKSIVVLNLK
jgi:alpha-N-arabinofuranosidase